VRQCYAGEVSVNEPPIHWYEIALMIVATLGLFVAVFIDSGRRR
jgi:hypothetical protein